MYVFYLQLFVYKMGTIHLQRGASQLTSVFIGLASSGSPKSDETRHTHLSGQQSRLSGGVMSLDGTN